VGGRKSSALLHTKNQLRKSAKVAPGGKAERKTLSIKCSSRREKKLERTEIQGRERKGESEILRRKKGRISIKTKTRRGLNRLSKANLGEAPGKGGVKKNLGGGGGSKALQKKGYGEGLAERNHRDYRMAVGRTWDGV